MKRIQKIGIVFVLMAAMCATMFGCTMSPQKKAFRDYGRSLQSDSSYWQAISESSDKMDTRDMTSAKAVIQASIIPNLDKIEQNAIARNSSITDPELQKADEQYVQCVQNLKKGYALILDGINNNDRDTVNQAINYIQGAVTNMKGYVTSVKSYMNKYGIKSDESMDEVLKELNSL